MKIFTEKAYREQIEKIKYEMNRDKYISDRLDSLTENLHQLEWRVQSLECNCKPVPVADMERRRDECI